MNKFIADADARMEVEKDDGPAARRIRVAVQGLLDAAGTSGVAVEDINACAKELGAAIGMLIETAADGRDIHGGEGIYKSSRIADALVEAGRYNGVSATMLSEAAKRTQNSWGQEHKYIPDGSEKVS